MALLIPPQTLAALAVGIDADDQIVAPDGSATLRWWSSDASGCWSKGKWGASRPLQGSYDTGPLADKTWFGIACSDGEQVVEDGITIVVREPDGLTVDIEADPQVLAPNQSTTVSWRSSGATWCWSRGKWGASRPRQGSYDTGPMVDRTWFGIACSDGDRVVEDGVTVVVRDDADGVSLTLSADPQRVRTGTASTLSWNSSGASWCTAGGAWSGPQSLQGSADTGNLWDSRTYDLTCGDGNGNTAWSSVTVEASDVPVVRWSAPRENEDGSTLTDLAGYWFYWGTRSGSYPNRRRLWGADRTQYRPDDLAPGTYYVALTAINTDGDESAHSNEIRIEVP